ncbi:MAG: FG-GAP repeat domain-containing protein [Desulfomonilaceae bacterium]
MARWLLAVNLILILSLNFGSPTCMAASGDLSSPVAPEIAGTSEIDQTGPGHSKNAAVHEGAQEFNRPTASMTTAGAISSSLVAQSSSETSTKNSEVDKVWRGEELSLLAVGLGVGDVDGDGKNEIVVADPSNVYVHRFNAGHMSQMAEYNSGNLEIKAIDVAKIRKQGPARIYVTAQNRGSVASFVLEYRAGSLNRVVQDFPYFLRVIQYPTRGPMLLGQRKGMSKMYEGPIFNIEDKGDELTQADRFGIPLKIPIFGFTIGDFEGQRKPLIAVYDKEDHLRIYDPSGKRLYVSKSYYGGSDVILRWVGPEVSKDTEKDLSIDTAYVRPRIMSLPLDKDNKYEILAISHSSKTMRMLSRTKMLEEGRIKGLVWTGDALEEKWATPKVQGMIADFTVDTLPGLNGLRLITLERKKTDWLAFLRSRSQIRAYDLKSLVEEGASGKSKETED